MTWKTYPYHYQGFDATLQRINQKKAELDTFRPIPPIVVKSIKDSLTYEWTYNSNRIEGNTLTLQETQLILQEGIIIKGKNLREHFEAVNHHDAIGFVEELAQTTQLLSNKIALDVHALVLQKIE